MKEQGHTVLLTTHDLGEAQEICDRIAIINHGRIVATGSPRELIARSEALATITLWASAPVEAAALARCPGVQDLACEGNRARFRTSDAGLTLAAFAATATMEASCRRHT